MGYRQYKLFDYTKASELLTGDDVVKADRIKQKIKVLQSQKILVDNQRLDIYYRDPTDVDGVTVIKIPPGGATAPHEKYAIAVKIRPKCIRGYDIPVAFFRTSEEAKVLLETIQAYLTYRYGV